MSRPCPTNLIANLSDLGRVGDGFPSLEALTNCALASWLHLSSELCVSYLGRSACGFTRPNVQKADKAPCEARQDVPN